MERLLDKIDKPNDIKNIPPSEYRALAKEIRRKLVRTVSETGGHLASNLGVVELTMALHLCLTFPEDKLVWDVGHQSYVHKILTGRADTMWTLRQMGGLCGFPSIAEDASDTFGTGHSSTSISVALGLAKARDLKGTDEKVFAVIGDGALSGGMAYEAMNNAAALGTSMVIVLNDNKMSIAQNVGGMSNYLGKIRANTKYRDLKLSVEDALDKVPVLGTPIAGQIRKTKDSLKRLLISGMLFEDMGLTYIGPIDGHNINDMVSAFETASSMENETVLVHVVTQKGKGYKPAMENPELFHGIDKFDIKTGIPQGSETDHTDTYTDVFGKWLVKAGEKYPEVVSVCAAMPDGTGVMDFIEKYPDRAFDVGIAEEHAVTFAAGMSAGGIRPVVSIYSTFLQRAYDQMIHDVCLDLRPVIFAIDRSGITGRDGRTHQGLYDISYLNSMPGMTVMAPMDGEELEDMLDFAVENVEGPVAVRYPRGEAINFDRDRAPIEFGRAEVMRDGKEVVIFAVGDMVETAIRAAAELDKKMIRSAVINMRFIKPFDKELVKEQASSRRVVVTMEDGTISGGFGESVGAFLSGEGIRVKRFVNISVPDCFVEHGSKDELFEKYGLNVESVVARISEAYAEAR
ncbi:MAG: 1-deoxy-D-xylulose-5-phosphate synthase [Eubacterium sp.]|nr:1-deoxy-D-xylulose-5-phosphate synthase [Eubacterium sp.]